MKGRDGHHGHHKGHKEHHRAHGGKVKGDAAKTDGIKVDDEGEGKEAKRRGGHVHGKHAKHRPDKRARGGRTSDKNPYTEAGKMKKAGYESKGAGAEESD